MRIHTLALALLVGAVLHGGENDVPSAISVKASPFPLAQVRLLAGPFKDAMERDRAYLHTLDADRLLHTWRRNAGLPGTAEPLGGWEREDCELRGHTMGHYLSACALMYASTGDTALKAKAERMVAELAKCQKALGPSGYLSAYPESFIDRVEARERVWAPYYTLHKVYAGLIDMYRYCGSHEALAVAEKMAAWNKTRLDRLDRAHMQAMLDTTEQGGMNEALANLYGLTGNADYLQLAQRFNQDRYVVPLARREDRLKGEHVNSFIPNIVGMARQYELTGNPRDRLVAEYFWDQVTQQRCYSTGGTSNHEHWRTDPGALASELGDFTQETCCTYNMLKLTRHIFCWRAESRYADYHERALYNSILSTQHPVTGMMMYFVPLGTGRWKMYNLPNDSFWCCTGTGMENHAKYGDSIYFHDGSTLYVNLFIPSEVNWEAHGVRLRQDTEFPVRPDTQLTVSSAAPVDFRLLVRVPAWADSGASARLNDRPLQVRANAQGYFEVSRPWRDGDRLSLSFPMRLHTCPMPDDANLVAFMYGPLVLAGMLGGEGLDEKTTHTTENWYRFPHPAPAPVLLGATDRFERLVEPVPGMPLTFRTVGQERTITLVPYHRLFGQRYVVYWRAYRRGSPAHTRVLEARAALARRRARIADEVVIGDPASEKAHGLKGERTRNGTHAGRAWRDAADGGWFSYDLQLTDAEGLVLACTFWGSDAGARNFDILVNGQKIATQKLDREKPGEFLEIEYPLPAALLRGKNRVTVRFQGHPGHLAGGVFGCSVLRAR